ncbi:MAG: flavodoxin family protein [Erysipelotrichales bacterium]|nr:flavodoxin family protein [Erysipelotrichales bacterium]
MKKILGICGSPRYNGNSEIALSRIMYQCGKYASTSTFKASQMNINFCDGCLMCEETGHCHIEDDMDLLITQFQAADIIIISTPVYFDSLPAICKNILDRTNPLCNSIGGKRAYILTFGQADETSWERACTCLENYFEVMDISVLGKYSFYAREKNDVSNNEEILKKIDEISEIIISICK